MSGLAAGIRLAMFDQKVLILEKHSIAGGLNSFYARKGRKLDVGLHAMTNFARPGDKNRPLLKICKQLRLSYSELQLQEQSFSRILFPTKELTFTNEISDLRGQIALKFSDQLERFDRFLTFLESFDETKLDREYQSARTQLEEFFTSEELIERLLCPTLIYGSAWEMDMDFSQFVIMFKALFLEGFSRPKGGVRTLLNTLVKRYKDLRGELLFRSGVKEIALSCDGETNHQIMLDNGRLIKCKKILSSAGLPETYKLIKNNKVLERAPQAGKMSFTESILFFSKRPKEFGHHETISFFNSSEKYHYRKPEDTLFDKESAVICLPNNFADDDLDEGIIRVTFIANYDEWKKLADNEEAYGQAKAQVLKETLALIKRIYPDFSAQLNFSDVFTPLTIKRFTSHEAGCVYGSEDKKRDGKTDYPNLFVCGTDQGFLGIVGALLSGISMANLHCLQTPQIASAGN